MSDQPRFYGKYRGQVLNNLDPKFLGRLIVQVPDVLGPLPSNWATPCVPFVGRQSGMFVLPQIGDLIWIEFEQGDSQAPIWVGGFWSEGDVPALALAGIPGQPVVVVQTLGQNTLMVSDTPGPTGGLLLKSRSGAFISISDVGITISNGTAVINMTGPTVDINAGALTII
jgi:hypothetical protein